MADTSSKIDKIVKMVDDGSYFTINRPRQYGKTTTLFLLKKRLGSRYLVISLSFEGIDETLYNNPKLFVREFILLMTDAMERTGGYEGEISFLRESAENTSGMTELSRLITQLVKKLDKKIIVLIDEVDKSLNNQHSHNYYEIFLVTEGRALHVINGKKQFVDRGCLVFIRHYDEIKSTLRILLIELICNHFYNRCIYVSDTYLTGLKT